MSFISDDCHYENVPSFGVKDRQIIGRDKMRAFLAPFFAKDPLIVPLEFHTEMTATTGGSDGLVIERVDYFEIGQSTYAIPTAGIFRVKAGKLVYWKDYFNWEAFEPVATLMTTLAKKK